MGCSSNGKKTVSASALAQMGVCERLVVFEHFDGKHPTPAQQDTLQRGLRAHRHFATCRRSNEARAGPCRAATPDFGERTEPQVQRATSYPNRDSALQQQLAIGTQHERPEGEVARSFPGNVAGHSRPPLPQRTRSILGIDAAPLPSGSANSITTLAGG